METGRRAGVAAKVRGEPLEGSASGRSRGDDRLEALWVLALTSGLRRGETLGLRWSNIDLDGAKLHVQETGVSYGKVHVAKEPKTARSRRQIPLSPVALEALRAHGTQ
jgi:integrase